MIVIHDMRLAILRDIIVRAYKVRAMEAIVIRHIHLCQQVEFRG